MSGEHSEETTISELVRRAVREYYIDSHEQRRAAMQRFVVNGKGHAVRAGHEEIRSFVAVQGSTGLRGSVSGEDTCRFGHPD